MFSWWGMTGLTGNEWMTKFMDGIPSWGYCLVDERVAGSENARMTCKRMNGLVSNDKCVAYMYICYGME